MLDLDLTPLTGDELREMRLTAEPYDHERSVHTARNGRVTKENAARRMQITAQTYKAWEREGVDGLKAAVCRLALVEGVCMPVDGAVTGPEVRALCDLLADVTGEDGEAVLARECGVAAGTVNGWCNYGRRQVAGKLLRYVVDLFGVAARGAA